MPNTQSIIWTSSSVEQDIDSMKKYSSKRGVSKLNHPMKSLRKRTKLRSAGSPCKALRCSRTSCGDVAKTIPAVLVSHFANLWPTLASLSPAVRSSKWSMRISNNSKSWASCQRTTPSCNLFNILRWRSPLASCFHLWVWPFIRMKNSSEQRMRMALPAKEHLMPLRTGSKRGWRLISLRSSEHSPSWWWTASRFASFHLWGCKLR